MEPTSAAHGAAPLPPCDVEEAGLHRTQCGQQREKREEEQQAKLGSYVCEDGDSSGELALSNFGKRPASVQAARSFSSVLPTQLLAIRLHHNLLERRQREDAGEPPQVERVGRREPRPDRADKVEYDGCLHELHEAELDRRVKFMRTIWIFESWSEAELRRISEVMTTRQYEKNTTIIKQAGRFAHFPPCA